MLPEWKSAIVFWWNRRRRFQDEWNFHRDAIIADYEALGYPAWRARLAARRRMGSRFRYQRRAFAELGLTCSGLANMLPLRSTARKPFVIPLLLFLGPVLVLLLNPQRRAALDCVSAMLLFHDLPATSQFIPLAPSGLVPIEMAAMLLRVTAIAGLGALFVFAKRVYARLYAGLVLFGMILSLAVIWVTGMQALAWRSWGHDGLQGFAILGFAFGFLQMLYVAVLRWRLDVQARCPYCLHLPGMPESSGNAYDLIVNPLETDSICFRGHGSLLRTRWSRVFRPATPLF